VRERKLRYQRAAGRGAQLPLLDVPQGAAFRFRASVRCRDLRRTAGEKLITWYESSPGTERGFCSRCGSPLLSRFSKSPELCGLPLGRLDTDPGMRQAMHIFVGSKAYWFEIADSLPRYEAGPSR
jgi:hypothetical protein